MSVQAVAKLLFCVGSMTDTFAREPGASDYIIGTEPTIAGRHTGQPVRSQRCRAGASHIMDRTEPIFVAGHRGLVGSAILRALDREDCRRVLTATRDQLDLRDQTAVNNWFRANRPQYVFLAAGTVGGIMANATRPAEFIYDNMMIHATVVHAAHLYGVRKLLYLGSSCIYPRAASQPMAEDALLTGPLEPTNESYAIAKIAGIKLCQAYRRQYGSNFISAMPTNLYGPHDNFDPASAHVLPAMIRKCHDARIAGERQITFWGTGRPKRELLYVDDLADACLFLMREYEGEAHINIGTGVDQSVRELADMVRARVHPDAELQFDAAKPDGSPQKLLDVGHIHALGWRHRVDLADGIDRTYRWFVEHQDVARMGAAATT
jgi:GDP-L-fucose synthase